MEPFIPIDDKKKNQPTFPSCMHTSNVPIKPSREETPTRCCSQQGLGLRQLRPLLLLVPIISAIFFFIPLIREFTVNDGSTVEVTHATDEIGCDGFRECFE